MKVRVRIKICLTLVIILLGQNTMIIQTKSVVGKIKDETIAVAIKDIFVFGR